MCVLKNRFEGWKWVEEWWEAVELNLASNPSRLTSNKAECSRSSTISKMEVVLIPSWEDSNNKIWRSPNRTEDWWFFWRMVIRWISMWSESKTTIIGNRCRCWEKKCNRWGTNPQWVLRRVIRSWFTTRSTLKYCRNREASFFLDA